MSNIKYLLNSNYTNKINLRNKVISGRNYFGNERVKELPFIYFRIKEGKIVDANNELAGKVHLKLKDILFSDYTRFIHPSFIKKFHDLVLLLQETGVSPEKTEIQMVTYGDKPLWVEITLCKIGYYTDVFAYNIEKRKQAQQKLQANEEKFKLIFKNNPDAIVLINIDKGCISEINNGFSALTGYTVEEIENTRFSNLNILSAADLSKIQLDLEGGRSVENYEAIIKSKTGSSFTGLISAIKVEIEDQAHILGVACDITDRRLAEQTLLKAKETAEASDRLKYAFLTNISHEVRTPLNGIVGFSKLLDNPLLTNDEKKEYIALIHRCSNDLVYIIDGIIDISQIESGQVKFFPKEVSPAEIVLELYQFFDSERATLRKPDVVFKYSLDPLFNNRINVDEGRVRQILNNLLLNAFKFTEKGFVEIGFYFLSEKKQVVRFGSRNIR